MIAPSNALNFSGGPGALPESVLPHRRVVRVVIEMHVGHGHPVPVLQGRIQRDAVAFLRHVLAHMIGGQFLDGDRLTGAQIVIGGETVASAEIGEVDGRLAVQVQSMR